MNEPGSGCHDLLRAATVALEVPGPTAGNPARATGFFVAPGIVATCAHALSDTRAGLPQRVAGQVMSGRSIELEPVPEWYLRAEPGRLDLAFLRADTSAAEVAGVPHVLLSGVLAVDDPAWAYGHPVGQFRGGEPAKFTYLGPSRLREGGGSWTPHRLAGIPVGPGYSGSPVVNQRTGAVCGMLCTSDGKGSAHMLAADDIIAGCPVVQETQATQPNVRWLRALTDQQIADGGWRYPGPRLRAYLNAAIRAAEDHPYPGVIPGVKPPPLTAVYVRQQAETAQADGEEVSEVATAGPERRPAEEILSQRHDCVLTAGPGAGKSSLLRTALISLAGKWLRGEAAAEVPVHVLAADLLPPSPLPDVIAASVTASLSGEGSLTSWPREFFGDRPLRGVRWLVLVDGLDEVLDPAARRRLLTKIAGAAHAGPEAPYRFIVATRPLAMIEFPARAKWRVSHFELQPFAAEQLTQFAERWFAELELPEPDQAARGFTSALDRAHLTDPARTPLLATMLCQLFAANPGRALPSGRAGAYQEFVDLLRSRQYEDGTSGIYAQMQALLGPYGPDATGPASRLLTTAVDLIGKLAYHRQSGGDGLAVDLLAEWTKDEQPRHVPEQRWRSFLREILRRSGLLTERADDFQFIHQTVGEYLAAQHVVADAQLRSFSFNYLFEHSWGPSPSDSITSLGPRSWDESYSRFLVAVWPDTAQLTKELLHIATTGRLHGCRFIAALYADAALPSPDIAAKARETLAAVAANPGFNYFAERRTACELLAQLHDPRGANVLAELAAKPETDPPSRRSAAETLARLGDNRGVELLAEQAAAIGAEMMVRQRAAESLARFGDPRSARSLAAIAAEAPPDSPQREDAVRSLIRLDAGAHADLQAARANALASLAANQSLTKTERLRVSEALARLGDCRGANQLAELADDTTLAAGERLSAARTLTEVKDSRGAARLAALAASGPDEAVRRSAAGTLDEIDRTHLLLELALDATGTPGVRYGAAEALAWINDSRRTRILAVLAADPAIDTTDRLRAAQALARAGDRRGLNLLAGLATVPGPDVPERRVAAWTVTRANDHRGSLLRQILTSADSSRRRLAAMELAGLIGDQALHLLEVLAADCRNEAANESSVESALELAKRLGLEGDPTKHAYLDVMLDSTSPFFDRRGSAAITDGAMTLFRAQLADLYYDDLPRRRAAEALATLGVGRGADILEELAANSRSSVYVRIESSLALDRLGDPRAAELLRAIVRDQSLSDSERLDAAEALTLADEQGAMRFLEAVAVTPSFSDAARLHAAEMLTRRAAAGAPDVLAQLASDPALADDARVGVAELLSRLADGRGTDLLAALVSDPDRPQGARVAAAESLASACPVRAIPLLINLATDPQLLADIRGQAAELLARLDDANTADALAALAADESLPVYTRIEIASGLTKFDDPRASQRLTALAEDPSHDAYARKWAADALAELNSGRGPTSS